MRDPFLEQYQSRLLRVVLRWLTQGGNKVNLAVADTAVSVAVAFTREEPDALFGVTALPNWGTTVWFSAKAVTGCTINFGTAAGPGATVDVSTFRSE